MKNLVLFTALVGLSACDLPIPNLGGSKGETKAIVTRDNVTLTGPRGFCVDRQSSTLGPESAFVVFGNCAAIAGSFTAPQPDINAIVTSTGRLADPLLPKIGNSSAQLSTFFGGDVGQILLSRSNDPTSIDVIESGATAEGAFFIFVKDTSDGAPEGTEDTYWRAYLDVKDSAVTISVLSLDANPLTRAEGLSILKKFSDAIQSAPSNSSDPTIANPPQATKRPNVQNNVRPVERPGTQTPTDPQKTRTGLLGRLFG
jgi:hypothetical protein